MTDLPSVEKAWSLVMGDVREIEKKERNSSQNFSFRGIDTVMNAVGPALRKHGVIVYPSPEDITVTSYQTSRGTTMSNVIVKMRYTVRGPAGDSFDGGAYGEAADAGDKAVSKAQSVAYRVFLLQGLTIPTDEPDPDVESHQRASSGPSPATPPPLSAGEGPSPTEHRGRLNQAVKDRHLTEARKQVFRAELLSRGIPQKTGDMTEDQARDALKVLNEKFPEELALDD